MSPLSRLAEINDKDTGRPVMRATIENDSGSMGYGSDAHLSAADAGEKVIEGSGR
jgi:hypothetical protein